MKIKTKGLNIGEAKFFVSSHGDCMDSDNSPLRIHEGDIIGLHEVEISDVANYKGKLVGVVLTNGMRLIKEMVGRFETTSFSEEVKPTKGIILKCYNPKPKTMYFQDSDIVRVFAVDCHFRRADLNFIE